MLKFRYVILIIFGPCICGHKEALWMQNIVKVLFKSNKVFFVPILYIIQLEVYSLEMILGQLPGYTVNKQGTQVLVLNYPVNVFCIKAALCRIIIYVVGNRY